MKNYQSIYYKNYYAKNEEGKYVEVDREVCFAPAEQTTKENPYKQRWFYDVEAEYAVRLDRNQVNEDTHRFNSSSLKKEERYKYRKFACIWKNTSNCDQNCNSCNRKNTSRTVELDKTWTGNSGEMESSFAPIDETQDIFGDIENKEFVAVLVEAYEGLSTEDQLLFNSLVERKAKKEIAKLLDITVDGVRYRELQLRKKLLSNKDLKEFLNK